MEVPFHPEKCPPGPRQRHRASLATPASPRALRAVSWQDRAVAVGAQPATHGLGAGLDIMEAGRNHQSVWAIVTSEKGMCKYVKV